MPAKRTLIKDRIVPSRKCSICRQSYTPRYEEQTCCPGRCNKVNGGRMHREEKTARLLRIVEARKQARNQAIQTECREQWGELSIREIEIFKYAMSTGFKRGLSRGYVMQKRQAKVKAA
jgi:hypothetical protein